MRGRRARRQPRYGEFRSTGARGDAEHRNGFNKFARLPAKLGRGRGDFLDQGRILLGGLVHLADRFPDLGDACALLNARGTDLAYQVGDAANAVDHVVYRRAGAIPVD